MRNSISSLLLMLLFLNACAQDSPLIVQKSLIDNWEELPVYPYISETVDGHVQLMPEYRFLDSVEVYRISYLSDGLQVTGFLGIPAGEGPHPCIIYNRGGNRDFGALTPASVVFWMGSLLKEGYVVIASNYRGNGGGEGMEEFGGKDVNDVVILPNVLAEVPEADTSRIGMYGWSRGGMMTYMAMTRMPELRAVAVGGGVADHFAILADRPGMESVYQELIHDYENQRDAALETRSAVMWADQIPTNIPMLIMHGTSDWRVKPEQSLKLALELEKYRVPFRLIMYEGGDHGLNEFNSEVDEQALHWFNRYVRDKEPLPDMEFHGK